MNVIERLRPRDKIGTKENVFELAAQAVEEIELDFPPTECVSLQRLVELIGAEPVFDPITHYAHGNGSREAALTSCRDLSEGASYF